MDAQQLSQPWLALTDEMSGQDNSHDSRKRTNINRHLWFVDDDQSRVVFFRHEAIYQAGQDDRVHLRFIAVSLRLNGLATQQEIAEAFGHSVRTQRDWETQFQKEGLPGLLRKLGSGRRSQVQASQEILLRRWFQQGVTQKQMAERLGVGIDVVKRALARLGLRRRKTTTQTTIDWSEEQDTARADQSKESPCQEAQLSCHSAKPDDTEGQDKSPSRPASSANCQCWPQGVPERTPSEPVSVPVGGGPIVLSKVQVARVPVSELTQPPVSNADGVVGDPAEDDQAHQSDVSQQVAAAFTIDRDPTDRGGDRAMARVGLLEDALPLFAEADHLPRAGVLLAVPLLVQNGLLDAFRKIYGRSLGPSFYGLRTLLVTLFLWGAIC
jgi:transposase